MTTLMTLPQLLDAHPAIGNDRGDPARDLSAQYAPVCSADVARVLYDEGWAAHEVQATATRGDARFARHLVRFRAADDRFGDLKREGSAPELVWFNGADGQAAGRGLAGFFEFLCSNGLIVGETAGEYRRPHRTAAGVVLAPEELVDEMLQTLEPALHTRQRMADTITTADSRRAFALDVAKRGWPDLKREQHETAAMGLLNPRRWGDVSDRAWKVFNVVQENAIQGGLTLGRGPKRARSTRRARAVERVVDLNTLTWDAAVASLLAA